MIILPIIIRNSCLASMDLNKCGTSRGGIRCKWGDNQTWSWHPQKHLWCSKWSRAPVNDCVFSQQISCSLQLFSIQWPCDQPCPAPNCLARQLWLSRTCNLDHGSKATCSTFSLACYEKYDILGTSCLAFSTMWTTLTRWLFEECKPWTHLAFLSSWNQLELRESARLKITF